MRLGTLEFEIFDQDKYHHETTWHYSFPATLAQTISTRWEVSCRNPVVPTEHSEHVQSISGRAGPLSEWCIAPASLQRHIHFSFMGRVALEQATGDWPKSKQVVSLKGQDHLPKQSTHCLPQCSQDAAARGEMWVPNSPHRKRNHFCKIWLTSTFPLRAAWNHPLFMCVSDIIEGSNSDDPIFPLQSPNEARDFHIKVSKVSDKIHLFDMHWIGTEDTGMKTEKEKARAPVLSSWG